MDELSCFRPLAAVALFAMFTGAAFAQNAPEKKTLVVNGRAAEGAAVQIDGHFYVNVETLAQIMNATVSFAPGRVILTVPAAEAGARPERAAPGLSREFAMASISQLAEMREWKNAIASAMRFGIAAGTWLGPWLQDHRVRAEGSLRQTGLVAKTESDQKALQLLKNELSYLGEWDSDTQASIHALNAEPAVNPAVAQNDPRQTKISECANFLNAMLISGEFADSPSCH
ncbi:MAG: hypothetical protein LAN64_14315 [Acidobacteriia bacterium]|nr:hypothetical protein [Terriglobia bacterium]